ncbi:MAG: TIGR02996 domain-containing protein [Archangium sp.]
MTPLVRAIDGWRQTKHPRFVHVAELATARALPAPRPLVGGGGGSAHASMWNDLLRARDPLDVPRLLATVCGGDARQAVMRLEALMTRDDPRVVTGVLAMLETPPYRAPSSVPFFEACVRELVKSGDPRVGPALTASSKRFPIVAVANLPPVAGESFGEQAIAPLSGGFEALARELEAMFERDVFTKTEAAVTPRGPVDEASLLDAIYAAPDDDAPRLVFADALMERGDPRGEFIALQLQRARGDGTRDGFIRERALFSDKALIAQFGAPLWDGGDVRFTRGFPEVLSLQRDTARKVIGLPALRTLTELRELQRVSSMTARELLQHGNSTNLRRVHGVTREHFDVLEDGMSWREVGLLFPTRARDLERLTQLETLFIEVMGEPYPIEGELSRLRAFHFNGRLAQGVVRRLTGAAEISLDLPFGSTGVWDELRELPSLRTLTLRGEPAVTGFNLPQLTSLEVRVQPDIDLARLLDVGAALRSLHVESPYDIAGLPELLAAARSQLARLEVAEFGLTRFERPFADDGVVFLKMPFTQDDAIARFAKTLARLPEGIAQRAVLQPRNFSDASAAVSELPKEEHLELVRRANPALPVEVQWY